MDRTQWELEKCRMAAEDLAAVAGDLRTLRGAIETLRDELTPQPKPGLLGRLLGR